MKIIGALTLALVSCSPLLAQDISGSTTIQIDPATNIVTATCETDLNGEADTGYYAARVGCIVTDGSGNTVASGAYSDDGDVNGYADVTLTFTGVPGTTYTATGGHTAAVTVPFDAPQGQPQGLSFDPYNFQSYTEAPQTYQNGYDWLGPGPEENTRQKALHIGNTTAGDCTAPTVPISLPPTNTQYALVVENDTGGNTNQLSGSLTTRNVEYDLQLQPVIPNSPQKLGSNIPPDPVTGKYPIVVIMENLSNQSLAGTGAPGGAFNQFVDWIGSGIANKGFACSTRYFTVTLGGQNLGLVPIFDQFGTHLVDQIVITASPRTVSLNGTLNRTDIQ